MNKKKIESSLAVVEKRELYQIGKKKRKREKRNIKIIRIKES